MQPLTAIHCQWIASTKRKLDSANLRAMLLTPVAQYFRLAILLCQKEPLLVLSCQGQMFPFHVSSQK